jgi:phosphoribosylaminoimidazolecarboxamide formyltransferase / IMP cyclohydrolase
MHNSEQNKQIVIKRAFISLYHKTPAKSLIECLHRLGVELVSTGGTYDFIRQAGIPVRAVEELTGFPAILGGRVKTLHPAVFGGILARGENQEDALELNQHGMLPFDMVVVDLYPFEETVASGGDHQAIIEKIDIGGISLIRAAAKNYQYVTVVPSADYFDEITTILEQSEGHIGINVNRRMAAAAMHVSSHYDTAIFNYLNQNTWPVFKQSISAATDLRYGENPHQQARFYGEWSEWFDQLSGKPLSYNNLLDVDAAVELMASFKEPAFAIIKHTNPCGLACRETIDQAWTDALAGDPVSAFGGILISNRPVSESLAAEISKLFFEALIAPGFDASAIEILKEKKNRILLKQKEIKSPENRFRSILNGVLWQTADNRDTVAGEWTISTHRKPDKAEEEDMVFGNIAVRQLKSNAIALVKNKQLLGVGTGQTSRVDALKQAIAKAGEHGHSLQGAVMASDAFFPFPDCVEIAHRAGITSVIQPGGSVKDQASADFCNQAGMTMVMTGIRHFKH